MLLAILKNIGEPLQTTDIQTILQEQQQKLKAINKILVCDIDLKTGDFSLSEEDYDENRITEYLPGFSKGSSQNYSPAIAIKTQKSAQEKDFSSITPDIIITIAKIEGFENVSEDINSPVNKFGKWFSQKKDELKQKTYDYYKDNYLEKSSKGTEIINKKAPKYLFFRFTENESTFFPGSNKDFKDIYLEIKTRSQHSTSKPSDNNICCLACGSYNDDMIPLKKCGFYDFFSLDQLCFALNFNNSGIQGMICSTCEKAIRQGYFIANTILRFNAYQIQISQSKSKYIEHIILPLTTNPLQIKNFINYIEQFRQNSYDSKQKTLRQKIVDLNHQLEKFERKRQSELKKEIKDLEKKLNELENEGVFEATKWLDEAYLTILREAAIRNISIMDLYFEEVIAGTSKKKVVYEILFGDNFRIRELVNWLDETDKDFQNQIKFDFGKVFNVFGERIGKKLLQALFTGKPLNATDLYNGAYNSIWNMFRSDLKSGNNLYRYWRYEGPKIIHYSLRLLQKANLLGEI